MVSPLNAPRALRQRRQQRTQRLLALEAVSQSLLSVATLTGAPVVHSSGAEVGRLVDIVVRWEGEPYPPLTGLVVRVGRRLAWVPADKIEEMAPRRVTLRSVRFDLRDVVRRDNEVRLADDVLDHQMVDVDGVRVFRAADLFLARVGSGVSPRGRRRRSRHPDAPARSGAMAGPASSRPGDRLGGHPALLPARRTRADATSER